jgi:hypothetical protein
VYLGFFDKHGCIYWWIKNNSAHCRLNTHKNINFTFVHYFCVYLNVWVRFNSFLCDLWCFWVNLRTHIFRKFKHSYPLAWPSFTVICDTIHHTKYRKIFTLRQILNTPKNINFTFVHYFCVYLNVWVRFNSFLCDLWCFWVSLPTHFFW